MKKIEYQAFECEKCLEYDYQEQSTLEWNSRLMKANKRDSLRVRVNSNFNPALYILWVQYLT